MRYRRVALAKTFVPAAGRVPADARAAGPYVPVKASATLWLRLCGLLLLLLTARLAARAQPGVTSGATTAPDVSAVPAIIGKGKGGLLPRVAAATGMASPATGRACARLPQQRSKTRAYVHFHALRE